MSERFGTLVFDSETDGLLDTVSKVHIVVIKEYETSRIWRFVGDEVPKALDMMDNAEELVGQNIIAYDLPVLEKVYGWQPPVSTVLTDTLVLSRLLYPNIKEKDYRLCDSGELPRKLMGKHGLEAWGYRLKRFKGDYAKEREEEFYRQQKEKPVVEIPLNDEYEEHDEDDAIRQFVWGTYNDKMGDYCVEDVELNFDLYHKFRTEMDASGYPEIPVDVEHQVAEIMINQELDGVYFDIEKATEMALEMSSIVGEIEAECFKAFPNRYLPDKFVHLADNREEFNKVVFEDEAWANEIHDMLAVGVASDFVPQIVIPNRKVTFKDQKRLSKFVGHPYTPIKLDVLNPTSRKQIGERLTELGWQPNEFTPTGLPKINDETLNKASEVFPITKPIAELFTVKKRLSQLQGGKQAWMRKYNPVTGRIHHVVNSHGAITGRATHKEPNLAQVPRVVSVGKGDDKRILMGREGAWGYESRALFKAPPGYKMVGCDLEGIELRCLAHYMAEFDKGVYGEILLNGDIHTKNMEAAGLKDRDQAKTMIYCLVYGGGDEKLGFIIDPLVSFEQQKKAGSSLKAKIFREIPALGSVVKKVKQELKMKGFLIGLDGRRLFARAQHSALNTLLQAAAAIISKYWMIFAHRLAREEGLEIGVGKDYWQALWIHDELNWIVKDGFEHKVASILERSALMAGEYLNFRLPSKAKAKIGDCWAKVH